MEEVVGAEIIDHRLLNLARSPLANRETKQAGNGHTQKKKLARFKGGRHFGGIYVGKVQKINLDAVFSLL